MSPNEEKPNDPNDPNDILPPVDTENQWLKSSLDDNLPAYVRGQYDGMVTRLRHDRELVRMALAAKDEQIEAANRRAKDFEEGFERVSPAYGALCVMLRNYGLPTEPKALAVELERRRDEARTPPEPNLFDGFDLNDSALRADLREACAAVQASVRIAAEWSARAPEKSRVKFFIDVLLRPFRVVELIRTLGVKAGVTIGPTSRGLSMTVYHVPAHGGIVWENGSRSHIVTIQDSATIVAEMLELPANAGLMAVLKVFRLFAS